MKYKKIFLILVIFIILSSVATATTYLSDSADSTTGWTTGIDGFSTATFGVDTTYKQEGTGSIYVQDLSTAGSSFMRAGKQFSSTPSPGDYVNASFYVRFDGSATLKEWTLRKITAPTGTNSYTTDVAFALVVESGSWRCSNFTSSFYYPSTTPTINTWHHINVVYTEGSGYYDVYIDDVLECNNVYYHYANITADYITLQATGSSSTGTAWIDNINIATVTPTINNFTITAKDIFDSSTINNFSAVIDGEEYITTTGTITTNLLTNDTGTYTLQVLNASNSQGQYFNESYTGVIVSSSFQANLTQAKLDFFALEKYTNNNLTGTFKVNGSTVSNITDYPIRAGSYNFTFINSSYYQKELIQEISALYDGTLTVNNVTNTKINVTVKNAYTDNQITTFTGWIYNIDESINESFSTNNSYIILEGINGNYTVFVDAENYSISSENLQNITLTNMTTYNLEYSLYSQNSVRVRIYDENTNLLIVSNVTITVSGPSGDTNYYTSSGQYFFENLTDGEYSFKFSASNYTIRSYNVTVADRSTQSLYAYLSSETFDVVFSVLDYDSGTILEGADFTMYRQINSTWQVIESKNTDVSGRAQFSYLPGVKYKFVVSKEEYDNKIFYLDPVIFDSYNIRLSKTVTLTEDIDYLGLTVVYYPKYFEDNKSTDFTWYIHSSSGVIEYYNLSVSYPGGSYNYSGINLNGESFNMNITPVNASLGDYVNISYCYKSTLGSERCFFKQYLVMNVIEDDTLMDLNENDYGLSLFDKVLISVAIAIFFGGLVAFVAGSQAGGLVGVVVLAVFSMVGFLPLWTVLIPLLLAILILSGGGRN